MTATPKLCECGCGSPAPIARRTWGKRGYRKGDSMRFIHGHFQQGTRHPNWRGGRGSHCEGYVTVTTRGGTRELEHVAVAAAALGKPLPSGAVVHHVNGDRADNRPANLVVCDSHAYHVLLHYRAQALEKCGHADWRRCRYCNEWAAPSELKFYTNPTSHRVQSFHRSCELENQKMRRLRRKAA